MRHKILRKTAHGNTVVFRVVFRMAFRVAFLAAFLLGLGTQPRTASAETIGGFFTLANTFMYTKGPRQGRRFLVRPRLSFQVVDITTDDKDRIWYLVVTPGVIRRFTGQGWITQAPHEIGKTSDRPVRVFSKIPTLAGGSFETMMAPSSAIKLLNESTRVKWFDKVIWQKVEYRFNAPGKAWAREAAGIFRAGKTDQYLLRVYGEMVTRGISKGLQIRLLSGIVRVGDTMRQVQWAFGDPLRRTETKKDNATQTNWEYQNLRVVLQNGVVKTISGTN
ncbi:MAG: hypothetical protein IIC13_02100 [SAR324 cluster bacterium]|nr:hypothetical protein [SAR324 cluster bacterium]MCH8885359.1 hypothetical protein [SAR324 cluster bacterium]